MTSVCDDRGWPCSQLTEIEDDNTAIMIMAALMIVTDDDKILML